MEKENSWGMYHPDRLRVLELRGHKPRGFNKKRGAGHKLRGGRRRKG